MTDVLPVARFDAAFRAQDDLYRYVNGTWLETATIPEDKPMTGAFIELRDASEKAVHEICEELVAADPATLDADEQKIALLYGGFLDADRAERLDAEPLEPVLTRVEQIENIPDLHAHIGWCLRYGIGSLLGLDVEADPGDPQRYVLFVAQDGLGLPDESYYREPQHADIRAAYVAHVEATLALAGYADAAQQAAHVMELETAIAGCHWDRVRTRDMRQMYNLTTVGDLVDSNPDFGWDLIFDGAGAHQIGDVVNAQPSFFTDVVALQTEAKLPMWRAWARWHAVSSLSPYLSSRFVNERFSFYEHTLQGTPQLRERWKRAVAFTEGVMGEAIGRIYVARHFSPESKDRMDVLVANLIEAYRRSITNLDWMTDDTKAEALEKLARFRPKIGYPAKWRDYSDLIVMPDDLVGNAQRASSFELDYALSKLKGGIDPDEWLMYPQTVNAYYHPLRNEIVFPAAILQPPFFNPEADDAVNYGGIGAVIGHEIGHGFDDQGSTCDGMGRLRDWWTQADREAFETRTKALIGQYDALAPAQVPDEHVNGELTIGENIGDLGGLGIAIDAWRIAGGEPQAPVDGYTGLQRLFLSWATVWQAKARDELVRQRLTTDPHSPPEFRCNQVVRNLDEFYNAFDVTDTDKLWLAPEQRVKIW